MTLTDDPEEVIDVLEKHREYKKSMIAAAERRADTDARG